VICIASPIDNRGRITKESSILPVSVGRLEQKCFQLATKSGSRPQQLQLCRQRVPCSRCGDRESPVVDLSTGPRHDEVARRRSTEAHSLVLDSVCSGWLGIRVVSVLDSGAEGPGFKSQSRRCRVTVLGKLFTPIVPLFTKQQNW